MVKPLNKNQIAFADHYLELGNVKAAYVAAGYNESGGGSHAYKLLADPRIEEYMAERTNQVVEASNGRIADASEVLEFLTGVVRDLDKTDADRLRAAEMLGKRYGLFVERKQSENLSKIQIQVDYGDE